MNRVGTCRWVVLVAPVFATLFATSVACLGQTGRGEVSGISRPSEERKLTFNTPGLVKETHVKEGEKVNAGQPLLSQDDDIDRKELERLELLANSTARIEAAVADLKVKQAVLKRKTEANSSGGGATAFGEAEIEEAENDVTLRDKQLQVAKEEQQEAKIKSEQQAKKLEKMKILSPYDGIVHSIVTNPGEWADPQSRDGVIVVVKNDPVYIEVRDLSTRQVAQLSIGQKLQVRYADDKADAWQQAEIFFFSPVADAASDTQMIKLKLPNPQARASGLQMVVKLPDKLAAAGAEVPTAGAGQASR